jgi:integrase
VVDGTAYEMVQHGTGRRRRLLACRQTDGTLFDPVFEETEAFWAWAAIGVMRLSGLRIEEVMELTHLSIRRYTQPDGQVVPLLQVAPSKIDAERVFPISPELVHVFAQIIERARGEHPTVPLCPRYDTLERTWGPPLPHLFQRQVGGTHQVFSPASIRNWLDRTLERADLRDVDGTPIRFVPHDFRRLFATEVVNTGLPIHIAAAVLGHRGLDTTRGYTAVYPEEVIRHYQTFIHERRTHRPIAEYRQPTDAEWPTATATGPTAALAPTNTPASAAPCCVPNPADCRC